MSYLSSVFFVFISVVLIVYYLVPKTMRGVVLLCASLIFYASFNIRYLCFLFFTALTTFYCAKYFDKFKQNKLLVGLCIAINVLLWFTVKDIMWIVGSFTEVTWTIIVPIGISYYTLQAISYLVDVSKRKIECENQFWKYLLYLSYFPAVVQGPISRYSQLMPELLNERKYSFDNISNNLIKIMIGLIKKMVIADRLGIFVENCYAYLDVTKGVILYIGAILYSVQLYADFSGCVDLCRGVSGLFGVELVENFDRPYLAGSIKEFWKRWHKSFSNWLMEYVYIPLGGNRKGTSRKYINLILTFLVSGIWHGAGMQFIALGLIHALYQIIGEVTVNVRREIKHYLCVEQESTSDKFYKRMITFSLVSFAWIFFRANNIETACLYIKNMFSELKLWTLVDGSVYEYGLNQNVFALVIIHICIWLYFELHESKDDVVAKIKQMHIGIRWSIYLILVFDVLLFGVYGSGYAVSKFMYGGF